MDEVAQRRTAFPRQGDTPSGAHAHSPVALREDTPRCTVRQLATRTTEDYVTIKIETPTPLRLAVSMSNSQRRSPVDH